MHFLVPLLLLPLLAAIVSSSRQSADPRQRAQQLASEALWAVRQELEGAIFLATDEGQLSYQKGASSHALSSRPGELRKDDRCLADLGEGVMEFELQADRLICRVLVRLGEHERRQQLSLPRA